MLREIFSEIINSKTFTESKNAATTLFNFYEKLSDKLLLNSKMDSSTKINGGIALSHEHAADCIIDHLRTTKFIKGIYACVLELKKMYPGEVINILYAGSGPYGTLIIPILSEFKNVEINVTVIDIHESSIKCLRQIVEYLGFEKYIKEYVIDDASVYKGLKEEYHLVISETMDVALTKEPQVMITKNIVPMLKKDGFLVPQEIAVSTQNSFYAKEISFIEELRKGEGDDGDYSEQESKILFKLNKKTSFKEENFYEFNSEVFAKSEGTELYPDICIYTEVRIFKDEILKKGESLLTMPYCVSSIYNIEKENYRLNYSTKDIPIWRVLV